MKSLADIPRQPEPFTAKFSSMDQILPGRCRRKHFLAGSLSLILAIVACGSITDQEPPVDALREMQRVAIEANTATWGRWGLSREKYSSWINHSNRLIPVYTFGWTLDEFAGDKSCYRDEKRLREIYGYLPANTLNPRAEYLDQTDIFRIQKSALLAGKKHIILMIFDGMDWDTTRAAATYRARKVTYDEGRGNGLAFQDYRRVDTDFGYMVTSPKCDGSEIDVNAQLVMACEPANGGYSPALGGESPWSVPGSYSYLIDSDPGLSHEFTDSASSATSMTAGIKTYNKAINIDTSGNRVRPIAWDLQDAGFQIGVVTSVPISHATPAAAYASNVTRDDYQDITRDLLGLASSSNRKPLRGVDVLIGAGWGVIREEAEEVTEEIVDQGENFEPGNRYIANTDLQRVDVDRGGKYVVAQRKFSESGAGQLKAASGRAVREGHRLFGFFGTRHAHLPYATADGRFDPVAGVSETDVYEPADIHENPTLADMTQSALDVLTARAKARETGFWLMVEPGDVDWANHNNNIDDSIGAVLSGDDAFRVICNWAEKNQCWDDTVVILTADHGHLLVVENWKAIADAARPQGASTESDR
jgi:alkaline phosphatase